MPNLDKKRTKVVKYRDDDGKLKQSILPIDAPDSDAALGIPISLNMPSEWEPHRERIEAALVARGIATASDLHKPGADDLVRQSFQQIIRLDVSTLKALNPK